MKVREPLRRRASTRPMSVPSGSQSRQRALRARLGPYWKMETANALLVPAFVLWIAPPQSAVQLAATSLSLAAACVLLVVGARYWFAVVERSRGDSEPSAALMKLLDRWERPILVLVGAACITSTAMPIAYGWSGPNVAALICAVLAVLEYVNYFQVQLQNFDHGPDWRRLWAGKGLRRAHLGRDLAQYRASLRLAGDAYEKRLG